MDGSVAPDRVLAQGPVWVMAWLLVWVLVWVMTDLQAVSRRQRSSEPALGVESCLEPRVTLRAQGCKG